MEIAASTTDLEIKVTNQQILSIAIPIEIAILVQQINMLTNTIFLGHLDMVSLGNAGVVRKSRS